MVLGSLNFQMQKSQIARPPSLLLTGVEPFDRFAVNPSWEACVRAFGLLRFPKSLRCVCLWIITRRARCSSCISRRRVCVWDWPRRRSFGWKWWRAKECNCAQLWAISICMGIGRCWCFCFIIRFGGFLFRSGGGVKVAADDEDRAG